MIRDQFLTFDLEGSALQIRARVETPRDIVHVGFWTRDRGYAGDLILVLAPPQVYSVFHADKDCSVSNLMSWFPFFVSRWVFTCSHIDTF